MTLQTMARTALAAIAAAVPESVVVVSNALGESCNGIRDTMRHGSGQDDFGERGATGSTVRVDASLFTRPIEGNTITVDSQKVIVLSVHDDSSDALTVIEYQVTEEVA